MPDVIIPAAPGFVEPAVPAKKNFKKAQDLIKATIIKSNSEASNLDFTDFVVTVDATTRKLSLKLKDTPRNNYVIAGSKTAVHELSYNDIDFGAIMTSVLGFGQTYIESSKQAVIDALPTGVSYNYEESTQLLTVTVAPTNNVIKFEPSDATLCTALFAGKTFVISFVDAAVDIATKITNTTLSILPGDVVEA